MPNKPKEDLTGKKFGKLTVIKYIKGGKWKCLCECGKTCEVKTEALTNGRQKSCGCHKAESNKIKGKNLKRKVGQRFGELEVLEYVGSRSEGAIYKCKCHSCGRITEVNGKWLTKYKSCGCLREKKRQEGLEEYLNMMRATKTSNNIFKETPNKNSTTGVRGVSYFAKRGIYVAQIGYKGKNYRLKYSKDINECINARKKAEDKIRELAKEEIGVYKNPTEAFTDWYEHLYNLDKTDK